MSDVAKKSFFFDPIMNRSFYLKCKQIPVITRSTFFSFSSPAKHVSGLPQLCSSFNSTQIPSRQSFDDFPPVEFRRSSRHQHSWSITHHQPWLDIAFAGDGKVVDPDEEDDKQLLMLHHHQQQFTDYSTPSDEARAPFSCHRCGRSYRYLKTRNRHMRHECGVAKHFACVLCGHRTQRSDRLLTHIRSQHPNFARDMPTRRWTRQSGGENSAGYEAAVVR